jgi:hypothetical protein
MAKWLWNNFKLKSRLISYDGKYQQFEARQNGEPSLIEQGVVKVFDALQSPSGEALADTRRLSEGYWPRKTKGGETYFRSDEKCLTDWGTAEIGAYLIDDISSLSDIWLSHIVDQQAGFKSAWTYTEGGYDISGGQDGHYGIVQRELTKTWKGTGKSQGFHNLPVKYVITAAKVEKGVESYRRKRVKRNDPNAPAEPNITTLYGPKAAGQALTPFLPGWFCDTLHIGRIQAKVKGSEELQEVRVAYYDTHLHEQTDVPFLCRVDLLPDHVIKLREKWKHGFIPLGLDRGLDKFYEFILGLEG